MRARAHARTHTHTNTHTHTHAHTHARTHARTHTHTHTRTHIRMHSRTHARTHAHTHAHTHTRTHTHAHTHMYKRAQSTHKLPVHSAKGFANFSASLASPHFFLASSFFSDQFFSFSSIFLVSSFLSDQYPIFYLRTEINPALHLKTLFLIPVHGCPVPCLCVKEGLLTLTYCFAAPGKL